MSSEEQNQALEKVAAEIREKAASVIQDWAALSTEEKGEIIGSALTHLGLSVGGGVAAAKASEKIAAFAGELISSSSARRVLKAGETIADQGAKHADDVVGIGAAAEKVGKTGTNVGETSILKSIRSNEKHLKEHRHKLQEYINDPDKYDNLGYLKNAGNAERRQKIITTRVNHLENEIRNFEKQISELKALLGGLHGH